MMSSLTGVESKRSLRDFILQPVFNLTIILLSSTVVRLILIVGFLLPAYIFCKAIEVLPNILKNLYLVLSPEGRNRLLDVADEQRAREDDQARWQLDGSFTFREHQLLRANTRKCLQEAHWSPHTEWFSVCGASVGVVHQKPAVTSGQTIVLLHGNPSWAFMWRNVIMYLNQRGHEVYALDWIGHGLSDKPTKPGLIAYELHIQTLRAFFMRFKIRDCCVVAQDWGGSIALSTIPDLAPGICTRLFLLNTFFLPRPSDMTPHGYLLYAIWFLSTGVFGSYIPEWIIMRYMSPSATSGTMDGYCAPFSAGAMLKASVNRFAHMVPGLPDALYNFRGHYLWRTAEGLLGPSHFTNITTQAKLAQRDVDNRSFWAMSSDGMEKDDRPQVMVAFGHDDPLLGDFKGVLTSTMDSSLQLHGKGGLWIENAGHYPNEERPLEVAQLINNFVAVSTRLDDGVIPSVPGRKQKAVIL